jgi:2'-5' RNA ligase/ribosome silencing factor RsfS/YbeB/iojap
MSLLRAFIAIEIPNSIQEAIQKDTLSLRKTLDSGLVRWTSCKNLHLTLKFLGDVSESNLQFIKQMLTQECAEHPAFDLQVGRLGSFPNSRRARVIWVGLSAPNDLLSLQHSIEAAASRLGYEKEERGFSPHLTIGRVRQNLSAADLGRIHSALDSTQVNMLGNVTIKAVHLFKSDLQPSGSVYTRLFSAPLNGVSHWLLIFMRWNLNALELARSIVNALEDKKGEDIVLLDLKDITSFTDYFVICTGTSDRMLDALADGVMESIRKHHRKKGQKTGLARDGWVVVDYGDVVVHLFASELRDFYDLEELWSDGKVLLRLQ